MVSENDIIDAVTAKLTGQFYVGQRVRKLSGAFAGATGTVVSVNEDHRLAKNGDYATWQRDDGQVERTFFWALEAI